MHIIARTSRGEQLSEKANHKVFSLQLKKLKQSLALLWRCSLLVFFALCSLNFSVSAFSAPIIDISSQPHQFHLSEIVDVYDRPIVFEATLAQADKILSPPFVNHFYPINLHQESLANTDVAEIDSGSVWLRFALRNTSKKKQILWLVLGQYVAPLQAVFQVKILDDGSHKQLGIVDYFSYGDGVNGFYQLALEPNETWVYLVAAEHSVLARTHLKLTQPHAVIKEQIFEASYISTLLGMALLLSLLFYLVSFEKKSSLFLYFSNFSFCILMICSLTFLLKKGWFVEYENILLISIFIFSFLTNVNVLLTVRQYLINLNCLQPFNILITFYFILSIPIYAFLGIFSDIASNMIWLPCVMVAPVVMAAFIHVYIHLKDNVALILATSRVVMASPVIYTLLNPEEKMDLYLFVEPIFLVSLVADLLLLGYCFYITDTRLLQHQLHNKHLLQLNASKHKAQQEIFSQLSQDLRTPISAIIGTSEILKNGVLDDEQINHVQGIEKSAHSVLNKITDIYHRTKSFQESEHLETAPFEIHYLIDQCLESFTSDIKKRSLELIVDIDADIASVVVGHSFFLRTVLIELIDNAVKSTSQGHIILRVEYVSDEDGTIRFTIEDTGRGIDSSQLELIQAPVKLSSVSPDALGINLVKQLLFELDTQLQVSSHIGEGSRFSFDVFLPASQLTLSNKPVDISSLEAKRLLIIDDNHSYSRVLRVAANSWGLEAKEAFEGAEGLALFRAKENIGEAFDAIIIDNDIPNMPAIEVVRRIKATSKEMPAIIMLTGFSPAPSLEETRDAGVDIILNKPVSQRLIQTTLINFIETPHHQKNLMYGKTRALIAEDNDVSRRVISKMMEVLDVDYKLVSDGKLAVDAVKKETFDIILMDCEMPIMNGFDAAEAIHIWQAENYINQTPIYALTAHVFEEHEERSKKVGMQGFLEKPIQLNELSNLIEKHSVL